MQLQQTAAALAAANDRVTELETGLKHEQVKSQHIQAEFVKLQQATAAAAQAAPAAQQQAAPPA